MPDFVLSILNNQLIQGVNQGNANRSAVGGPPGGLGGLPSGTLVNGFVVNRDQRGNPIIRTANGDLTLKGDIFLRTGAEVVVRVENFASGPRARLLSVDGKSPATAAQEARQPPQDKVVLDQALFGKSPTAEEVETSSLQRAPLPLPPAAASVTAKTAEALPQVPAGAALIKAVFLSPSPLPSGESGGPLPAAISAALPTLAPGSEITVKIISNTPPAATPAATPSLPGNVPTGALYAAYARQGVGLAPLAPPAATGATPSAALLATPASPLNVAIPVQQSPIAAIQVGALQTPAVLTQTLPSSFPGIPLAGASSAATPVQGAPLTQATSATQIIPPPAGGIAANPATPAAFPAVDASAQTLVATLPPSALPAGQAQATPGANIPPQTSGTSATTTSSFAAQPQTPNASLQILPGGQIEARVISSQPLHHESIVQTPLGAFRLPYLLPQNSLLVLELGQVTTPPGVSSLPAAQVPQDFAQLAKQWSSLQETYAALRQIDPALAMQTFQRTAPQIGSQMTAGAMLFITALRNGDLREWLGSKAFDALEQRGRRDLLSRLSADFSTVRNSYLQAPADHWQPLLMPMMMGQELHQARLFVKRDREEDKKEKSSHEKGTRFVLELELTALGGMQFDGFVKKRENRTIFDLVIRSLAGLESEMREHISRIFNDAAEITGFKGSLQFQVTKEFPIHPMEEVLAARHQTFTV